MLEHPDITRTLETGYPYSRRGGRPCGCCGGWIPGGEGYYEIFGLVCCRACVEDCWREDEA